MIVILSSKVTCGCEMEVCVSTGLLLIAERTLVTFYIIIKPGMYHSSILLRINFFSHMIILSRCFRKNNDILKIIIVFLDTINNE